MSEIIRIAGGTERLWPHIKTHKSPDLTMMLLDRGITRFKCATIAECEMVGSLKPSDICLAYPLVDPNIGRFAAQVEEFPEVRFWAIADDLGQLEKMNEAYSNLNVRVLIDLDLGMNRTGVPLGQVVEFMEQARFYENLSLTGFHCYDGHIIDEDYSEREDRVEQNSEQLVAILEELKTRGLELPIIISGGSITFTIHVKTDDQYFSPGTYFLNDKGYYSKYREVAVLQLQRS